MNYMLTPPSSVVCLQQLAEEFYKLGDEFVSGIHQQLAAVKAANPRIIEVIKTMKKGGNHLSHPRDTNFVDVLAHYDETGAKGDECCVAVADALRASQKIALDLQLQLKNTMS